MTVDAQFCHRHPKQETTRRCSRCDQPSCNDCLRDAPVGQHCLSCLKAGAPAPKVQLQRAVRSKKARVKSMTSPATRILIAMNLTVFVLGYAQAQSGAFSVSRSVNSEGIIDKLILWAPFVRDGEYYRLLTAGFLHAQLFHVGMNMLALWRIGQVWEQRLGTLRFVGVYMASLFGGALAVVALAPQNPVLGASGALFGFLGLEFVAYRQRKIPISKSPLAQVLVINTLISFFLPVSITGHVGGAVVGALLGGVFVHPKRRGDPIGKDAILTIVTCLVLFALAIIVSNHPIDPGGVLPR